MTEFKEAILNTLVVLTCAEYHTLKNQVEMMKALERLDYKWSRMSTNIADSGIVCRSLKLLGETLKEMAEDDQ